MTWYIPQWGHHFPNSRYGEEMSHSTLFVLTSFIFNKWLLSLLQSLHIRDLVHAGCRHYSQSLCWVFTYCTVTTRSRFHMLIFFFFLHSPGLDSMPSQWDSAHNEPLGGWTTSALFSLVAFTDQPFSFTIASIYCISGYHFCIFKAFHKSFNGFSGHTIPIPALYINIYNQRSIKNASYILYGCFSSFLGGRVRLLV